MQLCIPPELFNRQGFKEIFDIKDSILREQELGKYFDPETARKLNNKFEKTKLLKQTEVGLNNLIDDMQGINAQRKMEMKANMKETLLQKDRLLESLRDAGEIKNKDFLDIEKMASDVYNAKHNLSVSPIQAKRIAELTHEVGQTMKLPKDANGNFNIKYGKALENLGRFVEEVKDPYNGLKIRERLSKLTKELNEKYPDSSGLKKFWEGTKASVKPITTSSLKSMKATMDASFAGIQGGAVFTRNIFTRPKSTFNSLIAAFKAGGDEGWSNFRAVMFSDKNYSSLVESGARLIGPEELFGPEVPEILFGGLVKKPNRWFSAFLQHARLTEGSKLVNKNEELIAKTLGLKEYRLLPDDSFYNKLTKEQKNILKNKFNLGDIPDSQRLKEIADHANKITGTTNLGKFEKNANILNEAMFAPRFTISDVKMYTDIFRPGISRQARIRSVTTLGQTVGSMVGSYLLLAQVFPEHTEIRPNAANFMKFKIPASDGGDVWVGIKPKGEWLIRLASRIITQEEVSGKGKVTKYGEGYKPTTTATAIGRAVRSKLAPLPSIAVNFATGSDFMGKKNTFFGTLRNLIAPIAPSEVIERSFVKEFITDEYDKSLQEHFLRGFADFLGLTNYKIGE